MDDECILIDPGLNRSNSPTAVAPSALGVDEETNEGTVFEIHCYDRKGGGQINLIGGWAFV